MNVTAGKSHVVIDIRAMEGDSDPRSQQHHDTRLCRNWRR